ncbi:tetratricopeptide repeat protein [Leptospira weilii]|uniref:tetratricopeptide repeat protein n=1 Tax=Leptospira weilii TaxID=28184 RepID=UPI00077361EF|nr:hypothetical protein [Leptospira weilii]
MGYSYLFQKDLNNAFLNLRKAFAIDRKYSNAFYNLACVHALAGDKTEILDCLEKAITWSEKYQDYGNLSLEDEHFSAYWQDFDFRFICDRLPTEPNLHELYKYLKNSSPYGAFTLGEELRDSATDELAIIEAMLFAVKLILKDLDEHGKENIYLYDDKPISFWKEKQKELENDRKDRINSGKKAMSFLVFLKNPIMILKNYSSLLMNWQRRFL